MTMTQNLRIALRLRWVSPAWAFTHLGCLSLAQRISEMRRDESINVVGHVTIVDKWCKGENGKRWKAYRIVTA